MNSDDALKLITDFYFNSDDFNGIIITDIDDNFKIVRNVLRELLEDGKIVLNFGDRHPNPHILAFEPESQDEQLAKLSKLKFQKPVYKKYGPIRVQTNSINCCAYPSKKHLRSVVTESKYKNTPYTLLLALGEPKLSYKAFNLRILEFYRNDPRYFYKTDDAYGGHISGKGEIALDSSDDTFLETFGFAYDKEIKNRYVAVFLGYLSRLTPEHQQRWRLEEFSGDTFLHPEYARSSSGHWPEKESIFNAFCKEMRIINEMTLRITGKPLFNKTYDNKPKGFGFLLRPTRNEYDGFVQLLDKMMSDNLNKKFYEGKVGLTHIEKKGEIYVEKSKGTIALLEEWLNKNVRFSDSKPKDDMLKIFKDIRSERSRPAHHIQDDEWSNQYFAKQRETIMRAYQAIRTLRLILANHPLAKSVEVPDWLHRGEICTY